MTTRVIELNDSAIKLGDDSGILITSPGFALADDKIIHLGQEAERQARLKPTSSYNKYWHELSLEPFTGAGNFRHFADIAHAHLLHLAEQSQVSDEQVIFAVPGSFSQQQLAILLGIAGQTPLKPVGVVDSALAAAIASATAQRIIYVDMQLHQVVLTRLQMQDEYLVADEVIQIPGVGSQNFMDLLMQISTGLFIQQCRFNPQHNAESEQQLYNALPAWLQQEINEQGSLLVELSSGGNVYTAKLPRDELVTSLAGHYRKIDQQIQTLLADSSAQILLNPKIAELPGLNRAFSHHRDLVVVDDTAAVQGSLQHRQQIITGQGSDRGLHRIRRLPLHGELKQQLTRQEDVSSLPTHVLYDNQAFAASGLEIVPGKSVNGHARLALPLEGLPNPVARIERRGSQLVLAESCEQLRINDSAAAPDAVLQLGDRLSIQGMDVTMSLIRVNQNR